MAIIEKSIYNCSRPTIFGLISASPINPIQYLSKMLYSSNRPYSYSNHFDIPFLPILYYLLSALSQLSDRALI